MGVDGAFAAACGGGDFIKLGGLVTIANEDFLGGIEQACLRFLSPELLSAQSFGGMVVFTLI